jgi:hypothetical protein
MSMYLPNPAVGPAESEPAEFIDLPPMAHGSGGETSTPVETRKRPVARLSREARVAVTQKTREYITALVAAYGGNGEDVRSVVHDLDDQNLS